MFLSLCCVGLVAEVYGQAGKVYPDRPQWGDTIHIRYCLRDTTAGLTGYEPVYAKVTVNRQDGGYRWHTLRLSGKDTLEQSFVVPATAASLSIRFYTLNKDDDGAACKRYVYERGREVPVAGAYLEDLFSGKYRTFFEQELKLHPLNYLAYARYFNVVSMYEKPDDSKGIITGLIATLEQAYQARPADAGLQAALCVGYAKSGRLEAAKTFLFRLFAAFPQEEETALAFSLYNYEYYKATSKQIEEDVRQKLAVIFKQWPAAALTGDANVSYYLSKAPELTVADFEKALLPRYQQGSVPYYGLDKLPAIYIERREKPDSARAMLKRFIRLFQDGSINHQYRLSPGYYQLNVSLLLQELATVDLWLQEPEAAIIHTSAAIALLSGSNYEGNFMPDLLSIRANAYRQTGNMNMALEDYKHLYQMGKETALDSISLIFSYCMVKEKSVEALVASLQKKSTGKAADKITIAPDFKGTDMQGRVVQLSALKGKVVVVNFWGTGCGPCIGEMPMLNKLVQKYKGSGNVVFLAITGDETERLKQFFKKRTFLYTVVNNGGKVSAAYDVESLPVHIVIGKNGEVINRSTGAREDIFNYLDTIIKRSL
jgi:thiol-disulfide isomerase/thioredoxin